MTSPGLVYVDEDTGAYDDLRLPSNWQIHRDSNWGGIAESMRYCRERWPDATQYGWLADDMFPLTDGWDIALEEAAGDWHLAYAADLWMSHSTEPAELVAVHQGQAMTSAPCWGARLINAAGWWALPGVRQGGIDGAWNEIAAQLQLGRFVPEVTVEHRTWQAGKRERDETDDHRKHGSDYIDDDVARFWSWYNDGERTLVLEQMRYQRMLVGLVQ